MIELRLFKILIFGISASWIAASPAAAPAVSAAELIQHYNLESGQPADATRGEAFWQQSRAGSDQQPRQCARCHGQNLSESGKHYKSGKTIQPMAPSINPKRYTSLKKVEKWFKRNCKWTIGRECTPAEKSDLILYLSNL